MIFLVTVSLKQELRIDLCNSLISYLNIELILLKGGTYEHYSSLRRVRKKTLAII